MKPMSLRRVVSLMHGLGYSTTPIERPRETRMSSMPEVKRFLGGAVRYAPGGEA